MDGAGYLKMFFRISLPQLRPALAALGIITFTQTWNYYFQARVLLEPQDAMTLPVAMDVLRGYLESGNLATAGGLSSGIDLSLRVVERYFGREVATQTAYYMEYQGQGWLDPNSNQNYRVRRASTSAHPLCAVCDMEVDPASAPRSVYDGKTYYFCMPAHQAVFDKAPRQFLESGES